MRSSKAPPHTHTQRLSQATPPLLKLPTAVMEQF